jgi:hypothetical protein
MMLMQITAPITGHEELKLITKNACLSAPRSSGYLAFCSGSRPVTNAIRLKNTSWTTSGSGGTHPVRVAAAERYPAIDRNAGPHQPANHQPPRGTTARSEPKVGREWSRRRDNQISED